MTGTTRSTGSRLAAVALAALLSTAPAMAAPCEVGSYRLDDGRVLDIGPDAGDGLRWRLADGRTGALAPAGDGNWTSTLGWTDRPDGHRVAFTDCGRGGIRFDDTAGRRVPLVEIDTTFAGSGVTLAGRLTLPPGDGPVPLVVLVHGAERASALERYSLQREFASAGIGVFAYDKRGTGASQGDYTQDYLTLAIDAVHAAREARRLAGPRAGRIGYQGGSQGGWVAPLAARIAPVDFVIVSFGLAVSPLEEDREAIAGDIARGGFGPDAMAGAMDIADAAATLVASDFTNGYEQLDMVKKKYGEAPWYASVRGNFTWYLLENDAQTIRREAPQLLRGVPAHYDPMPVLETLDTPQLWLLGGEDRDAPPAETLHRLAALARHGRPITTVVFADAEHGMYEFETRADGERVSTRQPDGYFRVMADFIRGVPLQPRYGQAVPSRPGMDDTAASGAVVETSDVDLFYRIYDAAGGHPTAAQLQHDYLDRGSEGLHVLARLRDVTGQRIADAIAKTPSLYTDARRCLAVLPRARERLEAALRNLGHLYPEARFPPVTIAIGRGKPVAVGAPDTGIQVGLEALCAIDWLNPDVEDRIVYVLAHEYAHVQQVRAHAMSEKENPTVLEVSLLEGIAEFVGELTSGQIAYSRNAAAAAGHELEIETRFAADLDKTDLSDWAYNATADTPGDLGYWVGYRIAKAYYRNAPDKRRALREILEMDDAKAFLDRSGWSPGIDLGQRDAR